MRPEAAKGFVEVAARYFQRTGAAERPVSTHRTPEELAALFATRPPEEPTPLAEVLRRLEDDVVGESNWLYHPRYMGHQVTAPLPAPAWTDAVIGALNQSVAVQEMSPSITMIERSVVEWMCSVAGLGPDAGGTLTSGGTEATFTGLLAARAAAMPDAW